MSTHHAVGTLVLDPITCAGRGLCHDAAPELIELDEWGYPILPGGTLRADVTRPDLRAAEAATHACPVLALHIERSRGARR
jgi:ferredoxin